MLPVPWATLELIRSGCAGQVAGDAHVDHDHPCPDVAGQHVDGRAAVQEVQHHLRGNFLRVSAHALGHHAVIAGHDDHGFALHLRQRVPGDAGQLDGKLFQPAQAALGLGQHILPLPGGCMAASSSGPIFAIISRSSMLFFLYFPDDLRFLEIDPV